MTSIISANVMFFQNNPQDKMETETAVVFRSLRVTGGGQILSQMHLGSPRPPRWILCETGKQVLSVTSWLFSESLWKEAKHISKDVAELGSEAWCWGGCSSLQPGVLHRPAESLVPVPGACSCWLLVTQGWPCGLQKQNTKLHRSSKYMWRTNTKTKTK